MHYLSEVKIMPGFGKLTSTLSLSGARFSSDVNLCKNQVVALFCIKWDSSQSFPRVTLSLNLLHHLHGNQRPASERRGCLLNPRLASPPCSVFSMIENHLPAVAPTHSCSHIASSLRLVPTFSATTSLPICF